jgi:hypothetical protein
MNAESAQRLAQLSSLVVFAFGAKWIYVPWSIHQSRDRALRPLLGLHVFRYIALQVFAAQHAGYPISDSFRDHLVITDVIAAAIAASALVALRFRMKIAVFLAWALILETMFDIATNIRQGMHEHLLGVATGITWLVQSLYVPIIIVSIPMLVWQLVARRKEPLTIEHTATARPRVVNA